MPDFTPLPDPELDHLSLEELVAYHHAARRAGRHDEAQKALGRQVWAFEDRVNYWIRRKIPEEHVEDLVQTVFESALGSSFDEPTVGQFGSWLRRIAQYRIADFYDKESRRIKADPLVDDHERDEDVWGPTPEAPDFTQEVVERSVVKQALAELNEVHRRAIEIGGPKDLGFEGAPAKETAQRINDQFSGQEGDPMTDGNVHKILSRFRKRLADLLDADNPEQGDG